MKSVAILTIFVLLIASCKSNSTSTNPTVNFSADVNGAHWLPAHTVFGIHDTNAKALWIEATAANGDKIDVLLDSNELKPGTYMARDGWFDSSKWNWWNAVSGHTTVTSFSSTHASGTFEFKARPSWEPDTVTVTNGTFDLLVGIGQIPS